MSDIWKFAIAVLVLGTIFSILGVYNTGSLPYYQSWVFWTTTMFVGAAGSWLITPFLWSKRFDTWPNAVRILIIALIISVPISLTIYIFSGLPTSFLSVLFQYISVVLISVIVTTLFYFAERYAEISAAPVTNQDQDPAETFLARLPIKYRKAKLYAVTSEDHYLRVYTSNGEELILMRLADAVRELKGADGLQVHRSWWVARDGIVDAQRSDGRDRLVLPSGLEVPVSRSFRDKAKAAGLIG